MIVDYFGHHKTPTMIAGVYMDFTDTVFPVVLNEQHIHHLSYYHQYQLNGFSQMP